MSDARVSESPARPGADAGGHAGAELPDAERLRIVLGALDGFAYDWDIDADHVQRSSGLMALLGYAEDDAARQTIEPTAAWWRAQIHPDDLARIRDADMLEPRRPGEHRYSAQYRVRRTDGSWVWLLDRGIVICDDGGRRARAVGVATDVTAEIQAHGAVEASERRFRQLFEGMAHGVVYHDATGAILEANPAAERILGLAPGALRGVTSRDPRWRAVDAAAREVPGDDHPAMIALRTGETVRDHVLGVHDPQTGDRRWLLVNATPERIDGDSTPTGVFVTFEDISARRAAEEERDRALREALEASRAKSGFLATISHELRTPLNAMIGYSELLLMGVPEPLGAGATAHVERIDRASRYLLSIIEEILNFSRLEAGREALHVEPVDLPQLIDEVGAIVEPLAERKGLRFQAPTVPAGAALSTDPRKLRQILINLLGNAVKFTDRGGIEVRIETAADTLEFQVRDSGIGIRADHLARIFEPFWQAHPATTRRAEGTGLGLAVSRELARLMGGDLHVTSREGEGSTFTLRLPREHGTPLAEA